MSTQPPTPVEVAVDSNPFTTTLPAEQTLDLRPASVGSESSLHSAMSTNEVVVINSAKEEEAEHVETVAEEKQEDTPNKDEPSPGEVEETQVVLAEESDVLTTIVQTPEDTLNKDEPSSGEAGETQVVLAEESDVLTTIVQTQIGRAHV